MLAVKKNVFSAVLKLSMDGELRTESIYKTALKRSISTEQRAETGNSPLQLPLKAAEQSSCQGYRL